MELEVLGEYMDRVLAVVFDRMGLTFDAVHESKDVLAGRSDEFSTELVRRGAELADDHPTLAAMAAMDALLQDGQLPLKEAMMVWIQGRNDPSIMQGFCRKKTQYFKQTVAPTMDFHTVDWKQVADFIEDTLWSNTRRNDESEPDQQEDDSA